MKKKMCHGFTVGIGYRAVFQFKTHHLKTTSFHPPAGLEVSTYAFSGTALDIQSYRLMSQ